LSLGLVVSSLLAGCAGSPPWGAWSGSPSSAQVQAALGRPETFIYFSDYEIYQRARSREYVFQEQGTWVHRDQPPAGISESILQASPSVQLALTDTPEHRHAAVKQTYPRNWAEGSAIVAALP